MNDDRPLIALADRIARGKLGFRIHLTAYLVGCCFFATAWFVTSGYNLSVFPWFMFPVAGWGVGVAVHFMAVYSRGSYFMSLAEKEYRRMKGSG